MPKNALNISIIENLILGPRAPKKTSKAGPSTVRSTTGVSCHHSVPAILHYCIKEVEKIGLDVAGLYTYKSVPECDIPACARCRTADLMKRFEKESAENIDLTPYNVDTLCGAIKLFLNSRPEPLIKDNWLKFTLAAGNPIAAARKDALKRAIEELPEENRNIMAYIFRHLKKVWENPENNMSVNALSTTRDLAWIFGKSIVGYPSESDLFKSTAVTAPPPGQNGQIFYELMMLGDQYWKSLLTANKIEKKQTKSMSIEEKKLGIDLNHIRLVDGMWSEVKSPNTSHKKQSDNPKLSKPSKKTKSPEETLPSHSYIKLPDESEHSHKTKLPNISKPSDKIKLSNMSKSSDRVKHFDKSKPTDIIKMPKDSKALGQD